MTTLDQSLGEIVAADFRAASVLTKTGIDFCCGGKKSLREACAEKHLDPVLLIMKLDELDNAPAAPGQNFNDWPLDFLADYIVNTHHRYLKKSLPELVFYTQKIAGVHGGHHPELLDVSRLFRELSWELSQHLQHEEDVLFPAIKEALKSSSKETVKILSGEINRLAGEHEFAGSSMDKIHDITDGFQVPEDGCNTYQVTFKLLKQFEDDLHIHVHLENNILFTKALKL
jgi:regulator of cell morphogenesis and NO signaling